MYSCCSSHFLVFVSFCGGLSNISSNVCEQPIACRLQNVLFDIGYRIELEAICSILKMLWYLRGEI